MAEAVPAARRAEGVAAGPAQGPDPPGTHRRCGAVDRRGPRGPGEYPGDHRGGRHRLRVVLQPLRQQGPAVRDRLGARSWSGGGADRPGLRRHHRPGGGVLRVTAATARLGWTHPEVARFITGAGLVSWTSRAAWPRAPCATSRPGKPRASSPCADAEIALSAVAGGLHRVAAAAPAASRTGHGELGRRARRGQPAPARRPRTRSRPPLRPPAPGHRHVVTAAARSTGSSSCTRSSMAVNQPG